MKRRFVKIFAVLMALIVAVPASAVTLATDTFTGSDANPIGGNWTTISGGPGDCKRVSNALQGATTSGGGNGCRFTGVSTPNDSYSQVKIITFAASASAKHAAVVIRVDAAANTFYSCAVYGSGGFGSLLVDLSKTVAGTYTDLSNNNFTVAANDVIKVSAVSTAIKCYQNGTEILSTTDSAIAAGQAGILMLAIDAVTDVVVDDFEVGDFTSGGSVRRRVVVVD